MEGHFYQIAVGAREIYKLGELFVEAGKNVFHYSSVYALLLNRSGHG